MCICFGSFDTWTEKYGTRSKRSWTTWRDTCSCCGLESVRCQVRMHSFWLIRRLPNGSNNLARLDTNRSVCGIVVGHYRFSRRFHKNSLMPFSRWVALLHFVSSDDVVWSPSSPQVDMFYMFRICCCLFHWFLFIFAKRKSCVLEGFVVCCLCVFSSFVLKKSVTLVFSVWWNSVT